MSYRDEQVPGVIAYVNSGFATELKYDVVYRQKQLGAVTPRTKDPVGIALNMCTGTFLTDRRQ